MTSTVKNFKGAWPALITPSTPDGGVNLEIIPELVEYFISKNVSGLYLCGSTGEGTLLSTEERRSVAEAVIKVVNKRISIIVHVGSMNTRDSVHLAQHAQVSGADGISSILPTVPGGIEVTYKHFEAIAGAAPNLPFLPYLFGGQLDAFTLMEELLKRIPNISGAKYTGPNMYEMSRIIDHGNAERGNAAREDWAIFSGMDEQCIFGLMMGTVGNIGSTLNPMPGVYCRLHELYRAGDAMAALELQKQVNQVTTILISHGFHGSLREAMKLIGFDCGEPRLPHLALTADQRKSLHKKLEEVNFSEIAAI